MPQCGPVFANTILIKSLIFVSMNRFCTLIIAVMLAGSAFAQADALDQQYQDIVKNCHLYERHKDNPDLRYVRGQIFVVINKETPIPEVGAMFDAQGLLVKKLFPVGSAQLALVQVPPGEERRWIQTMMTYKPIACGYLNLLATPVEELPQNKEKAE